MSQTSYDKYLDEATEEIAKHNALLTSNGQHVKVSVMEDVFSDTVFVAFRGKWNEGSDIVPSKQQLKNIIEHETGKEWSGVITRRFFDDGNYTTYLTTQV